MTEERNDESVEKEGRGEVDFKMKKQEKGEQGYWVDQLDNVIQSYCNTSSSEDGEEILEQISEKGEVSSENFSESSSESSGNDTFEEKKTNFDSIEFSKKVDLNRSFEEIGKFTNVDLNRSFEECLESGSLSLDILIGEYFEDDAGKNEKLGLSIQDVLEGVDEEDGKGKMIEKEDSQEVSEEDRRKLNIELVKAEMEWENSQKTYFNHQGKLNPNLQKNLSSDLHYDLKEQERHCREMTELAKKALERELNDSREEEKLSPIETVDEGFQKKLFEDEEEELKKTVNCLDMKKKKKLEEC